MPRSSPIFVMLSRAAAKRLVLSASNVILGMSSPVSIR